MRLEESPCEVMVLLLPKTIKEKSRFRAEAIRREVGPSLETSIFFFIVSGSGRSYTFRVPLNALPTMATSVRRKYTNLRNLLFLEPSLM